MDLLNKFLGFELLSIGEYSLRVGTLVLVLLIIVLTKLILWGIKKSIFRKKRISKFNEGNIYSLYQILTYIVWVVAFGLILETLGIKVSLLIAGSAALW